MALFILRYFIKLVVYRLILLRCIEIIIEDILTKNALKTEETGW